MSDHQEGVSRRNFLKLVGVGTAAILGYKAYETFSSLEKMPTYLEINEGDNILLNFPGSQELSEVKISYREKDERSRGKLQVRMEDGKIVYPLDFKPETTTVRKVGEIVGLNVVKVKKNSQLPEDVGVHYYPNAEPPYGSINIPTLSGNTELYGISVITWPADYMGDGKQPTEINNKTYQDNNLHNFGRGYAIGSYNDGAKTFEIIGYVADARALEVVK